MLSRVAERMYWAGRYLERVEAMARLVQTHTNLLLDLPADSGANWSQLLSIIEAEQDFDRRYPTTDEAHIVRYLMADTLHPGSIVSSLANARENMRTSRDIVPKEGWECVNEFYLMARAELEQAVSQPRQRLQILGDCVVQCQRLSGLLSGTMSHGDAYNFLRIGCYLERVDTTSRVVDVAAATLSSGNSQVTPYANTLWMAVLKSLSAYQMYRQYVRRRITADDVTKFLLTDDNFPRAIAWLLNALEDGLQTLPRNAGTVAVVDDLRQQVALAEPRSFSSVDLHIFIDQLQRRLAHLHSAIEDTWFLKPQPSAIPAADR